MKFQDQVLSRIKQEIGIELDRDFIRACSQMPCYVKDILLNNLTE